MAETYESEKWVRGKGQNFYKVSQKVQYLEPYSASKNTDTQYTVIVEDSIPTDSNGGIEEGVVFSIECESVAIEGSSLTLIVQNNGKIGTGTGNLNQYRVSVPSLSGYDLDWTNTWSQFAETKTMVLVCAESATPSSAGRLHAISFSGTIPPKYITGDMIANTTIKAANLANNSVTTPKIANGAVTADKLSNWLDLFYPVGTYYETSNTSFNPNTAWGGTWVEDSKDKVLIGGGSSYSVGTTYGSNSSVSIPVPYHDHYYSASHTHVFEMNYVWSAPHWGINSNHLNAGSLGSAYKGATPWITGLDTSTLTVVTSPSIRNASASGYTNYSGSSGASISPLQSSLAVKRWHRTA